MQSSAIFPLFYLPPVAWFADLKFHRDNFLIEDAEHFVKQTYRNRAKVYSPNGPLDLIVPVIRGAKVHTRVRDVRISYDARWQRLHWKSLESCYRNSAYFEFYEDEMARFYEQRFVFLFDYNLELTGWLLEKLKLDVTLNFTAEYTREQELDFRMAYDAKSGHQDRSFSSYFQVFEDRKGFIPNLSIADLLFNQGPQARFYF